MIKRVTKVTFLERFKEENIYLCEILELAYNQLILRKPKYIKTIINNSENNIINLKS